MQPTSSVFLLFHFAVLLQFSNGARILGLFPLHGRSHFIMFEEVMKSLADKGHQVDVLSPFPLKEPYPNYTDLSIAESAPVMVNNMTYDLVQRITGASAKVFIDMTGNEVCEWLGLPQLQKLIKNPPTDPPYDLIIAELFYANCYFAFGRHLNVSIVALTSSPLLPYTNEFFGNPLNTAYVSEIGAGTNSYLNFWERLMNTFATWSRCYQSRYYTEGQTEIVKKYFGSEMPDIRELERELAMVLVNSHYSLNGIRPTTSAIVEVGGLHVREDASELSPELKEWLDNSNDGFIYFSFGSMVTIESFPRETLLEIYKAFTRLSPIRVLMKVAQPKSLPPGLPSNVLTLNWLPQIKVLKHKNIRVFVTHGGLMGVQEAVTFGVPLIGIPLFRDQPINMKNCADRGAALSLDYRDLTADKIVTAVNEIVRDPKYKKNMMKLSSRFLDRPLPARDTAVFWIEYILKHGGDALRSPALQLTWWQLALLDVYGSIIVAVLVIVYIIKLIISTILRPIINVSRTLSSTKKRN